jgi:hypothetical protein
VGTSDVESSDAVGNHLRSASSFCESKMCRRMPASASRPFDGQREATYGERRKRVLSAATLVARASGGGGPGGLGDGGGGDGCGMKGGS